MGFTTRPSKNRKRKRAEARRLARETNTVIDVDERTAEHSEISQVTNTQLRYTAEAPRSGEISPKQQEQGVRPVLPPKQVRSRQHKQMKATLPR